MEQKFKPVLFSTDMVRANLDNRKSQTRRIVKHKTEITDIKPVIQCFENEKDWGKFILTDINGEDFLITPNYQKGDILWVRETFKVAAWNSEEDKVSFYYKASPGENFPMVTYDDSDKFETLWEKTISELDKLGEGDVDNEECTVTYNFPAGDNPLTWKPSLFMPKEAARIFLKVTDVRCERLNDISESDAIAEGIESFENSLFNETRFRDYADGKRRDKDFNRYPEVPKTVGYSHFGGNPWPDWRCPISSFQTLWKSINGKTVPWESNPFIWVYTFEKIEKPINFK